MKTYPQLLAISQEKLSKALQHLDYSYQKIQKLPADVAQLDEENLETWESFAARFSRVADLFLMRWLRTYVLSQDPGFEGSLRDFVNQGEKLNIIDNANAWMAIRELCNITAHEYSDEDLAQFFARLKSEAPRLLQLTEKLHALNLSGS